MTAVVRSYPTNWESQEKWGNVRGTRSGNSTGAGPPDAFSRTIRETGSGWIVTMKIRASEVGVRHNSRGVNGPRNRSSRRTHAVSWYIVPREVHGRLASDVNRIDSAPPLGTTDS
jgi:hypothetical protein